MTEQSNDERETVQRMVETLRHLRGTADPVDITMCGRCSAEILPGQALCGPCAVEVRREWEVEIAERTRSNAKLR